MKNHSMRFQKAFLVCGFLGLATACGGSSGGSNDSTTTPTTTTSQGVGVTDSGSTGSTTGSSTGTGSNTSATTSAIDCAAAWKAHVAANPVGLIYAYKTTNETLDDTDTVTSTFTISLENRIVASSDEKVVTATTTTISGLPSTQTQDEITKVEYLESCAKIPTGVNVNQGAATILEQGQQTITVEAGTFNTQYTKLQANTEESQSTISSWALNDGSGLLVKSDAVSVATVGGITMKNHNVTELTKLVRP